MIGYAVEYNKFYYNHQIAHRIEEVFETEEMAWEYIEHRYYHSMNLDKIPYVKVINDWPGHDNGLNVYTGSSINEFRIIEVPIVFKQDEYTTKAMEINKNYERKLSLLQILYQSTEDMEDRKRILDLFGI